MKDIIKKITDIVTIVFPAAIAAVGVLDATGVAEILQQTEGIVMICLGALSSIASIVYNKVAA